MSDFPLLGNIGGKSASEAAGDALGRIRDPGPDMAAEALERALEQEHGRVSGHTEVERTKESLHSLGVDTSDGAALEGFSRAIKSALSSHEDIGMYLSQLIMGAKRSGYSTYGEVGVSDLLRYIAMSESAMGR